MDLGTYIPSTYVATSEDWKRWRRADRGGESPWQNVISRTHISVPKGWKEKTVVGEPRPFFTPSTDLLILCIGADLVHQHPSELMRSVQVQAYLGCAYGYSCGVLLL